MLVYLIIYIAILFIMGIADVFNVKDFRDFAVAGKRQSTPLVFMSLMATVIGASATIGVMGRVTSIGFPAFWWLAVGAIGLFLQSVLLSERVRNLNADTLPDLVGKLVGPIGKIIVAIIIIVSWPGIVASQILAMSSILALVTGKENNKTLMFIVALVVIVYTAIGGQLSVIKTDALQFIIIALSFVLTFAYLFFFGQGDNDAVFSSIELVNDSYGIKDLVIQFFIVGGTYLLGPDVISRNLVSKDGKTAKKSSGLASIVLLFFSVVVVLIGLWIVKNVDELNGMNPLLYIIQNVLPKPIGVLLAVGLLSTLLSSADTCLVNISSIIEIDILKRDKVSELRIWALLIGGIALVIAFFKGDIITMLTGAYSVYAPGIVCPLFMAIMFHGKRKPQLVIWLIGVICGGTCGFISTYINPNLTMLPITGFAISFVFSVISCICGKKQDLSENESETAQ